MAKVFEFYFDLVSPYSYLAATQIGALCERTSAQAIYKPVLLAAIMQATGNQPPLSVAVPPKQSWMLRDVKDWAAFYGIPLAFPKSFPFNSLKVQRLLIAAEDQGALVPLTHALYDALWGQGEPVTDLAKLSAYVTSAGFAAEAMLARTEDSEVKARLKANTDEAIARGAFGAPTFAYGNRIYWGNDRMVLLEAALNASA
jgi:2-hydroxychromene-2-carboxylate isomerase